MNAAVLDVYRNFMRVFFFLSFVVPLLATAQPARPELAVVFVRDDDAHPMRGAYATPIAAQAWPSNPNSPAWIVELHFTVRKDYPYSPQEIGTHMSWPLAGDTVRNGRQRHLRFRILDGYCTYQYLLVIQAGDTMRVDMPNDDTVRRHLVHHMVKRGAISSPDVIRFRPGRFNFTTLAQQGRFHDVELRIAQRVANDAKKGRGNASILPAPPKEPPARTKRSKSNK